MIDSSGIHAGVGNSLERGWDRHEEGFSPLASSLLRSRFAQTSHGRHLVVSGFLSCGWYEELPGPDGEAQSMGAGGGGSEIAGLRGKQSGATSPGILGSDSPVRDVPLVRRCEQPEGHIRSLPRSP